MLVHLVLQLLKEHLALLLHDMTSSLLLLLTKKSHELGLLNVKWRLTRLVHFEGLLLLELWLLEGLVRLSIEPIASITTLERLLLLLLLVRRQELVEVHSAYIGLLTALIERSEPERLIRLRWHALLGRWRMVTGAWRHHAQVAALM